MVDEIELILKWEEVVARDGGKGFLAMIIDAQLRQVGLRGPKIPFVLPHDVASVGEGWFALTVDVPADVVRMTMRENDRVDVLRGNPFGLQIGNQFTCGRRKTARACVHQNMVPTLVNQQADVRADVLLPLLRIEIMLLQNSSKALFGRVHEKIYEFVLGGARIRKSTIADHYAFEIPYVEPISFRAHFMCTISPICY